MTSAQPRQEQRMDLTMRDLQAASIALSDSFASTDDERFEAALDKINAEIERREVEPQS